jgi:hypothetical protein
MPALDPKVLKLDPSIKDHVATMIEEAENQYHCVVSVNQTQRTPEQAQTFHVLHMFLHNYFPRLRPKYLGKDGRTISWLHLKDPTITWKLIDGMKSQFLRAELGGPAKLSDGLTKTKKWTTEPDKAASSQAMARYLSKHGVSSMAAPGVDGCGEPCLCGGNASKHVSGKAADLSGLQQLGMAIRKAEPGKYGSIDAAVDHFLHGFHLWRPLAHLKGKARELWHVEALPPHVPKSPTATHPKQAYYLAALERQRALMGC